MSSTKPSLRRKNSIHDYLFFEKISQLNINKSTKLFKLVNQSILEDHSTDEHKGTTPKLEESTNLF